MRTLIVQSNYELGQLWSRHLVRLGADVEHVTTGRAALAAIQDEKFDVIVLDLFLSEGSALTIADFANYSSPNSNVVFVTDTTFFSDGSIFAHSSNARAFMVKTTPPNDLAAIVMHYGQDASRANAAQRNQVVR
ncbi:response regulator [Yoonia sp. MH D7]